MNPGGSFTNVSRALQNTLAKIYNTRKHIYGKNLGTRKSLILKYLYEYFCNTQISRVYFEEFAKR